MRIFSTRHGQVMPQRFFNNDMNFPAGDEPITELGRKQAKIVGEKLIELGFSGVIYASPYDRTMETASIISETLGIGFTPLPCLREMFVTYNSSKDFIGLRPNEIKKHFPRADILSDMPYPWWEVKDDELSDVVERLRCGLDSVLRELPKDIDVLLVGHAATLVGLRELFHPGNYKSSLHWNCCLNLLYSSDGETYTHDASFIPEDIRTANYLWYKDELTKFENGIAEGKAFFNNGKGTKLLHIGDIDSPQYNLIRKMICEWKPDVIIHTGDLADEIKAGRVECDRSRWKKTVPELLDIMRESGADVYVLPGNNDIESELMEMAGEIRVCSRNNVLQIGGKRILICHEVHKIDTNIDADIYLYGHGKTGETRQPDDNVREGKKYFNAVWGASLHLLEADKHLIIPKFEL